MAEYQADTTFVPVIPSFRGFAAAMSKGTKDGSAKAGAEAGSAFSKSFGTKAVTAGGNIEALEKRIAAAVTAGSKKVAAARETEEDATRKAKIEELKLQELRGKSKVSAAQLATAEDRLIKSQRALRTAQEGTTRATQDYDDAIEKGTRELKQARTEADKAGKSYDTLGGRIKSSVSKVGKGAFSAIPAQAKRSGETSGRAFGTGFGRAAKTGLGVAAGVLVAVKALTVGGDFLKSVVEEGREAQKVGAVSNQIIKATGGAAKVSAKELGNLTEAISNKVGVDDEAIQSGANLLLTFKKVRNEVGEGNNVFDRATQSAVDLSAAGFGSITGASKMLGKALNDPLKGISALSRAGVTFTADQKKEIAELVKKGEVLKAQKIILGEVESQVGGVAAKSATAGEKLRVTFDNLKEGIGTAFLPLIDDVQRGVGEKLIPAISGKLLPVLPKIVSGFRTGGEVLKSFAKIGEATLGPLLKTLSTGSSNLRGGLFDYLTSHQADIVTGFVNGGNAALTFGEGVVTSAATGLRSYANLQRGIGNFLSFALDAFGAINKGALLAFGWVPGIGDKLRQADANFKGFKKNAVGSLLAGADSADKLADNLESTLLPSIQKTRDNLNAVGEKEIFKASQRDAANRYAAAFKNIGIDVDGAQIKLKSWADISELSTRKQARLRTQINEARNALRGQVEAARAAGAGQETLTKTWEKGKERLYKEFLQMGLSKKEAKKLAAEYAGVKPKVETKVTTPGMTAAQKNTKKLRDEIANLKNKNVAVKVSITASRNKLAEAIYAAGKIPISGPVKSDGPGRGMARGGILPGYTPLSRGDDIAFPMARGGIQPLRGGEGITVSEVMQNPFERARLIAINKASLRGESLARFQHDGLAGGGIVRKIKVRADADHPEFNIARYSNFAAAQAQSVAKLVTEAAAKAYVKKINDSLDAGAGAINVNNPTGRTTWRGGTFTNLFAANLRRAEKISGNTISVIQGGFRPSTSYSGTSHRGDAIDTRVNYANLRAMRKVGIATGDRTGLGNWGPHMHAVPTKGAGYAGGSGIYQASDYLRRGGAKQGPRSPWGLADGGIVPMQLFDTGGVLQPGLTLAMNGTGKPETIRTAVQERQLQSVGGPSFTFGDSHGVSARDIAREFWSMYEQRERDDRSW